jgi:hypothetical protein
VLAAAKRDGYCEAGSSGLRIYEEAASASSRWRVWVEKEPSKEFGEVLRMGKGKARPGKNPTPRFSWANQRREPAAGQAKQGPTLQWSGDAVGTGRCASGASSEDRAPLGSSPVSTGAQSSQRALLGMLV